MAKKRGGEHPPRKKTDEEQPVPATAMGNAFVEALKKNGNWELKKPGNAATPDAEAMQTWESEGDRVPEISSEAKKLETEVFAKIEEKVDERITAETGGPRAVLLDPEQLNQEERELYLKLRGEKAKSYLAHVAEMRADKEKKEKRKKRREAREAARAPKIAPAVAPEPAPAIPPEAAAKLEEEAQTEAVPMPAVFHSNRERPKNVEAKAEIPILDDATNQEGVREVLGKNKAEVERGRLRNLVGKLTEITEAVSERFTKSKNYLNERAKQIDARAQTSGGEKMVRRMGEIYNKLNWREKLGIGLILGSSAVVTGGMSIYLPYAFVGAIGVQRAFGMASMYLSQEKALLNAKVVESGQFISAKERAAIDAVMSGAIMGAAIGKSIQLANEYGLVERTREWLGNIFGHEASPAVVGGASKAISPPTTSTPTAEASVVAPEPAIAGTFVTTEVPSDSGVRGFQAEVRHVDLAAEQPKTTGFQAEVRAVDNATIAVEAPRTTGFQAEVRAVDNTIKIETPKMAGFQAEVRAIDNAIPTQTEPRLAGFQSEVRAVDNATVETPAAAAAGEVATAVPASEMPSVEVVAAPGKGYEWMMKQFWEQLQDKGLEAKDYPEGSDIRRLLEADPKSINTVIHELAEDNEFYKPDGTNVQINLGDKMTADFKSGNILLGEDVLAPESAKVTSAYHPEAATMQPTAEIRPVQDFGVESSALRPETVISPEPLGPPVEISDNQMVSQPHEGMPVWQEQGFVMDSEGRQVLDSHGNPIHAGTFEPPAGTNQFGIKVPLTESHIYADVSAQNLFAYGGSPAERAKTILEYLIKNPDKVIFSPDDSGKYRIPWYLVEGKATPGLPERTGGIFGFFSSWVKPPEPDDLAKIIK